MSHLSSFRCATRAAVLAACGLGVCAVPAQAATYEQISRATGANGASPFVPEGAHPLLTADDGRRALFNTFNLREYSPITPLPKIVGRDALTNVTMPFRGGEDGRTKVLDWDRSEQQVLAWRFSLSVFAYEYVLAPTSGGPVRVVYSDTEFENPDIQLTGDGTGLVFSSAVGGTRIKDLASDAIRPVGPEDLSLGRASVSDDGSVIAGTDYDTGQAEGGYFSGGVYTPLPASALVSANGKAVVYLVPGEPSVLHVRALPSGVETTSPVPAASGPEPAIQWISADGNRVVVAPKYTPAQYAAQAFEVGTKRWATFGGAFSGSIAGDELSGGSIPSSVLSRNGRYATLRYGNQVALVDLTGRSLAGGGDPLSASSYFRPSVRRECNWGQEPNWVDPSAAVATFERPAPWIPKPILAQVTIHFDGKAAGSRTLTKAVTPASGDEPASTSPQSTFSLPVPPSAETASVRTTIVDHAGRVITGVKTETLEPCDV